MKRINTKRIKRFCEFHIPQTATIDDAVKLYDIMTTTHNEAQISKLTHYGVFIRTAAQSLIKTKKSPQSAEKVPSCDFYGVYVGAHSEIHKDGAWACVIEKNGKPLRKFSGARHIENPISTLQFALFYALKTLPLGAITTVYTDNEHFINVMQGEEHTRLNSEVHSALMSEVDKKFIDYRNIAVVGKADNVKEAYKMAVKTHKTKEPIFASYHE